MARINGAAGLKALFGILPDKLKREIDAELLRQAQDLAQLQKQTVPRGDTGNLAASVRVEKSAGRELSYAVKAGGPLTTKPVRKGQSAQYDYALAAEHGTSDQAAQPFFYPSYRLKKPTIRRGVNRAIKNVIQQVSS